MSRTAAGHTRLPHRADWGRAWTLDASASDVFKVYLSLCQVTGRGRKALSSKQPQEQNPSSANLVYLQKQGNVGDAFQSALNVLLVEDDKELAGFVKQGLEDESCNVKVCHDGGSGLRQAELHAFDIILLDVMLPALNGFEVTKRLRLQNVRTPILLLTARDAPEDIVKGLDAGADDYLTKPFDFEVLLARVRARTRSSAGKNARQMRFSDLFLDTEKREAVRAGHRLELTRTEFSILECLMRSAGRVVKRDRIIELVWGDRDVSENNLDVFVRYLRAKVDRAGLPRLLYTERGVGYSIREGSD